MENISEINSIIEQEPPEFIYYNYYFENPVETPKNQIISNKAVLRKLKAQAPNVSFVKTLLFIKQSFRSN